LGVTDMTANEITDIDLFISHAWEDKESFVGPLARYLRNLGARVWYDEFSLSIGDSLSRSIDKGLIIARYGLVIISPDFIQKRWTEYELRGLTTREMSGNDKIILPVWHRVNKIEVANYSPTLADKVAIDTRGKNIEEVAEAIIKVIRPDLASRATLLRYLTRDRREEEVKYEDINKIHMQPIPAQIVVEGSIVIRSLNVVSILHDAYPQLVGEFSKFLTDLARDQHPEPELRVWETIAAVYSQVSRAFSLTSAERPLLVKLILLCSLEGNQNTRRASSEGLEPSVIEAAIERWDYLAEINQSGHVRFETNSMREDASDAEIIPET
jgi:hypothetical protein